MSGSDTPAATGNPRWLAPLAGLTSLGVLVQAVLAGLFIDARHTGLISVHGMVGNVVGVFALATAVYAFVTVRDRDAATWWASLALFVLVVAQIVIGHEITDGGHDSLITVHVPLAMVIFGLTVWVSVRAAVLRRAG